MIGLLDLDIYQFLPKKIIPNLEIMKLAAYYRQEENVQCQLLSLDMQELSSFKTIYCFSELTHKPQLPPQFSRMHNLVLGGSSFTQLYEPFKNSLIDYTLPSTQIYKSFLKKLYEQKVSAKVITAVLDNSYYRMYIDGKKLPIPPIRPKKQIYIYDQNIFVPEWQNIFNEISNRKPSGIHCVHPIECITLSDYFALRNYSKFSRENIIFLNLNIPLTQVRYMLRNYKMHFLADINTTTKTYLPLGGSYSTKEMYYKDFIYKMNLLYAFWSRGIMMKIKVKEANFGYTNPIYELEKTMELFNFLSKKNLELTLNDKIPKRTKNNILAEQKQLILMAHPLAKDLFNQSFLQLKKQGEWGI